MSLRLTESDLRFLVETVATDRKDHDHIIELVRDKKDFLEQMLEDPKLLERLLRDEEALVRASPFMLFAVLLRAVKRELQRQGYIYAPDRQGQRIAVFEAPAIVRLLSEPQARDYLVEMLCSFVKTNTGVFHWRERGIWHRRRFNDSDMDDLIALAQLVEPELRPRYYQRIADAALFFSGIFPEHAARVEARARARLVPHRTLEDYEQEGRRFYALAASKTPQAQVRSLLERLAEQFALARSALNNLSDRYFKSQRLRYFGLPPG